MLHAFVLSADENGGWLAQWPSPGNRGSMPGTHTDPVFADAIAKNIGGFDREEAYAAIRKNAFESPDRMGVGRNKMKEFLRLGYVPAGERADSSVSETLEFAYDDWAVAQVAKALGKNEDYEALSARAERYKTLWDDQTGFFRPKRADGKWFQSAEQFDPFAWATGFVEGGPWQGTWSAVHDVEGMAQLMGGKRAMLDKLDRMMGTAPIFRIGEYPHVIHEMTELARIDFGQYAHGNQPVHHVLYLFAALGQPERTQYWTRRVLDECYSAGPRGFAGDEDNGEQSSWYVLNALGLYQLCVGDPTYTLTSPLFDEATLSLPGGKSFIIRTKNNGEHNVYVKRRTLEGDSFDTHTIDYARLMRGGVLEVELVDHPQ